MDNNTNVSTARLKQDLKEIHSGIYIAANASLEDIDHCIKFVNSLYTRVQP